MDNLLLFAFFILGLLNMNTVDGVIIAALIVSAYLGARSGLMRELLGFTGWVIALLLAIKFSGEAAELLRQRAPRIDAIAPALAFILLLAVVRLFFQLTFFLVRRLLKTELLNQLDRLLGAVLGFLKGALLLSAVALLIVLLPLNPKIKALENDAALLHHLTRFARWSVHVLEKTIPETRTVLEGIEIDDVSTKLTPGELKEIYQKESKRAKRLKEQLDR